MSYKMGRDNVFDEDGSGKKSKRNKCVKYSLYMLVLVSFALSVTTLILFLMNKQNTPKPESDISYKDTKFRPDCVPCSRFRPDTLSDEDTKLFKSLVQRRDTKTDDLLCCANTTEQVNAWAKLVYTRLSKKITPAARQPAFLGSSNPDGFGSSLAFAQKSLFVRKKPRTARSHPALAKDETCQMEINPDRNDPQYESSQGVGLLDLGIKIEHAGLYFVYKSINFFPDSSEPCETFDFKTFKSILIRKCKKESFALVSNEHTCCPECTNDSETGFAGGVFRLEKGDVIQVNVTSSSIIHPGKDVTFMGLMMMGDQSK